MKFLKENWYKLMTGTAMLIFACGFFIYAVSPSYANETSEVNTPQMETTEGFFTVTSNGYLYTWDNANKMMTWTAGYDKHARYGSTLPNKRKLP